MTRTTPLRRIILHFAHIFFTDARTFIAIASVSRANQYTRSRKQIIPLIVGERKWCGSQRISSCTDTRFVRA
jgi:hypothetical protein